MNQPSLFHDPDRSFRDRILAKLERGETAGKRREDLLAALLDSFARGDADAVSTLLTQRMTDLEQAFDQHLQELRKQF